MPHTALEKLKQKPLADKSFVAFPIDKSRQQLLDLPGKQLGSRSAIGKSGSRNVSLIHSEKSSTSVNSSNSSLKHERISVKDTMAHHKETMEKFNSLLHNSRISITASGCELKAELQTPPANEEIAILTPDPNFYKPHHEQLAEYGDKVSCSFSEKMIKRNWRVAFAAQRLGHRVTLLSKEILSNYFQSKHCILHKDRNDKSSAFVDLSLSRTVRIANNSLMTYAPSHLTQEMCTKLTRLCPC